MRCFSISVALAALLAITAGCDPGDPGGKEPASDAGEADTTLVDSSDATPRDTNQPPDGLDADDGEETDTADTTDDQLRTVDDYQRCTTDVDCPVGLGVCVTSIPLNRADTDGTQTIPIQEVFPRLEQGEGVCTKTCTNAAANCSDLSVNGTTADPEEHTCQVVVEGEAPYPAERPDFPFDMQLDENALAQGRPFGAICRPPVRLDSAHPDNLCATCQMPDGCDSSDTLCWNPASATPAADDESGICLSACSGPTDCPLGFVCDADGGDGQSYCRPKLDTCGECRDRDGDGFGTGICRDSADQVTGFDCDDRNPDAYYDPDNPNHPFPRTCGQQDYNCNGLSDATEQIGSEDFSAAHCTACFDDCSGSVPNGQAACQSVPNRGDFCLPECTDGPDPDSLPDWADCDGQLANGCETKVDDPSRVFFRDADGDGYGDPDNAQFACRSSTAPAGHVANQDDCNDSEPSVYGGPNPSAEVCDGLDNDCDGDIDTADSEVTRGGTSCQSNSPGVCRDGTWSCQGSKGWYCQPMVMPGANEETCGDQLDNDCDGEVNEAWDPMSPDPDASLGYTKGWKDQDKDGWGAKNAKARYFCTIPSDHADRIGDCDDSNAQANPSMPELCSTMFDDDCKNGANDPNGRGAKTFYEDIDGDGYGESSTAKVQCYADGNLVDEAGDCKANDPAINPGAQELCKTSIVDEDCDGKTSADSGKGAKRLCRDVDGDGHGSNQCSVRCASSGGYTQESSDDCNDNIATINPDAKEVCDGIDDNCNRRVDEGCPAGYVKRIESKYYKSRIGPGGGSYQSASCKYDRVMTSASLAYYPGSWPVQELDVGCKDFVVVEDTTKDPYEYSLTTKGPVPYPSGNYGTGSWTADGVLYGQSSSTRTNFHCQPGEAVYKIEFWDDGGWGVRVKLYCRSYTINSSGQSTTVSSGQTGQITGFGSASGTKYSSECSAGRVAVGLREWGTSKYWWKDATYYNTLTGLELVCQKLEARTK